MAYPSLWTPQVKSAFLSALTESGEIIAACRAVNLSPQGAYRHRSLDPDFARAWDVAKLHSKEVVFDRLTSRALDGWEENVYYRGELVGTRQRHDNRLILALIARLDKLAPPQPAAPATVRAATRFAELLDDVAADHPLDSHFAPTREEREAIMIRRVEKRATYNHYASLMTLEEQEWVNGGPLHDFADDEEEWEEGEGAESAEDQLQVSPPGGHHSSSLLPANVASSPEEEVARPTLTPGSNDHIDRRDGGAGALFGDGDARPNVADRLTVTERRAYSSDPCGATSPEREEAETPTAAETAEDARIAALFETARAGRFGEMISHLDMPEGGPRIRVL